MSVEVILADECSVAKGTQMYAVRFVKFYFPVITRINNMQLATCKCYFLL